MVGEHADGFSLEFGGVRASFSCHLWSAPFGRVYTLLLFGRPPNLGQSKAMNQLILEGTVYHKGIAGDPIVLLTVFDKGPLENWCRSNEIFTQILKHKDPRSDNDRMAIYVTESRIAGIREGEPERLILNVRPDKRGNGIEIESIVLTTT